MKKRIYLFLLILSIFPLFVSAKEITKDTTILIGGKTNNKIADNNENTYLTLKNTEEITIQSNEDIYGIYIIYERESKTGTLKTENGNTTVGENNFLHEYINLEQKLNRAKEITLSYNENVKIAEIYIFNAGELPEFVEIWNPPLEEADLLLFSTHSDDEQLFFAGLLPTYVAKVKKVQVVYFTNHYDNPKRLHEQLHGLYTVGIRAYPVVGIIPDAYSTSLKGALKNLETAGMTETDALNFEVEMLRRFKPLVVVGHDELGEYSHGQHILNTYILKQAINDAKDKTYDESSYLKYGTWEVPKTYLHLYKENQITMDYDTPLEYFGGKTAYEVSKEGYKKHNSQQYTWFTAWLNGKNDEYTKATQIKKYSPCEFGLYASLVGEDQNKNDMFENILERKKETEKEEIPTETEEIKLEENIVSIDNNEERLKEEKNNYKVILLSGIILIGIIKIIIVKKENKND